MYSFKGKLSRQQSIVEWEVSNTTRKWRSERAQQRWQHSVLPFSPLSHNIAESRRLSKVTLVNTGAQNQPTTVENRFNSVYSLIRSDYFMSLYGLLPV